MKMKDMINCKVSLPVALLAIMAAVIVSEQIFLEQIKADNSANNSLALTDQTISRLGLNVWQNQADGKVALVGANIPLMAGAQRLTFDSKSMVRYRINAPAGQVAKFYRQLLAGQGWQAGAAVLPKAKLEKLTISYAENPWSGKTDVTYAFVPTANVLGVKIAEAEAPAPAPAPEPAPALTPAPTPTTDSNKNLPVGDQNQTTAPQQPTSGEPTQSPMQPQPINQPEMKQMEFYRQPMESRSSDQGSTQTCRVNGAEMPGSCEQYNNKGSDNQGSGREGQGQMGQPNKQGPSEEDQKKMDERRFNDMKRGISQFTRGSGMMKKALNGIKRANSNSKCDVGIPAELENALTKTDSLVEKIKAAKTADELDEINEDVQDVSSVMQDWGPRMGNLTRLCQMLKQADRDAKQFDRMVKKIEAQAKANKKIDLSEQVNEYKTAVEAQKQTLAQVKELAKTDPSSALEKLEDDFYGNMDNLGNLQMQIDVIVNIGRGIKNITQELNRFTSQIKSLARKKIDTAELQGLLDNLKAQVEEIKTAVKNKADAEELISKVEEMFNTRQELQDGLQEFGLIDMTPQMKGGANYNVKVNIPDAFKKNGGGYQEED